MKKRLAIGTALLLSFLINTELFAQNENDVLRYSTTDVFGSARFEAMAGSFGALGADFSAIQINPAGMGRFSSSNVSLSFNNSSINNEAFYNGQMTESGRNKFTLSSGGVVLSTDLSQTNSGRRYSQFSFGYTRLKNFSNNQRYEGHNIYSLLDVFAHSGDGIDPEFISEYRPFSTGLAYSVHALNYNPSNFQYSPELTLNYGDIYHTREINTEGGIGEFHIGYSENYMNQFYYGGSLGIRRVNYDENYIHSERLIDTVGVTLRDFDYSYEQITRGTGVNLKLGILYLPTEQFRLGLAFESPTMINLEDEWSASMSATHENNEHINSDYVPTGRFEYRIKTPMKLRASFAYIFGMRGAINMDLEMSRLQGGRLKPSNTTGSSSDAYTFNYENEEVEYQFRTIMNTRIGIEYMVYTDLYLRCGIAVLPQPYKKELGNLNAPNMTYSTGIGWDNKYLSIDLSYRLLQINSEYYAFDPSKIENRTEFKTNMHNVVLTGRLKF